MGNKTKTRLIQSLGNAEVLQAELKSYRFPVHFHDTFVIELVESGADWCCGNEMIAQQGEVLIHFPFAAHTGGTIDSNELRYQAIYPSTQLFYELTGCNVNQGIPQNAFVSSQRRVVRCARKLFRNCFEPYSDSGTRNAMKDLFELVLGSLKSQVRKANANQLSTRPAMIGKLFEARRYLLEHFDQDVTTEQLSQYCGVSPFHLIRTFKLHFGITPRQFIISQRVSAAKQMIAAGKSVASAAHSAGFADQSHLCRNFKRITGYNPGEFKRSVRSLMN